MKNFCIGILLFFFGIVPFALFSYSEDSSKIQFAVGNRVITPAKRYNEEKLVFDCFHCYEGTFLTTSNPTLFNPFVEAILNLKIPRSNLVFTAVLGFQEIKTVVNKTGSYIDYANNKFFEGQIYIAKQEYSGYHCAGLNYSIFNGKNSTVKVQLNQKFEYPIQTIYEIKVNQINSSNTYNRLPKVMELTTNFALIYNYYVSKKITIGIQCGANLFYYNGIINKKVISSRRNYDYLYNTPAYIQNYRSTINDFNYFNTSFLIMFAI